ncbi:MAG: insulinase family protein, partial [Saprospiraceae bacterium]|nr:insulinase family protein [Saprospiraceae bacterium]
MLSLNITQKALRVQRKVVVEEFSETCLNEPYGDAWHHLSDLMYQVHPYRWPVIGLRPEHVEQATVDEVRQFYQRWYTPNNAVLCISGKVRTEEVLPLVDKWFSAIPAGPAPLRALPAEPEQHQLQRRTVEADVPVPAVYLAFRMPARIHPDFYPVDLLTDILAQGPSARLYRRLVKEQKLFVQIDAYVTANLDPGLLVIEGKPAEGVPVETATAAIWAELEALKSREIEARELEKIKNRFESTIVFSETSILNKAQNLAFYEMRDRAELMNEEVETYRAVRSADLLRAARQLFQERNAAVLTYLPKSG